MTSLFVVASSIRESFTGGGVPQRSNPGMGRYGLAGPLHKPLVASAAATTELLCPVRRAACPPSVLAGPVCEPTVGPGLPLIQGERHAEV